LWGGHSASLSARKRKRKGRDSHPFKGILLVKPARTGPSQQRKKKEEVSKGYITTSDMRPEEGGKSLSLICFFTVEKGRRTAPVSSPRQEGEGGGQGAKCAPLLCHHVNEKKGPACLSWCGRKGRVTREKKEGGNSDVVYVGRLRKGKGTRFIS